jgi:hypothetical protein
MLGARGADDRLAEWSIVTGDGIRIYCFGILKEKASPRKLNTRASFEHLTLARTSFVKSLTCTKTSSSVGSGTV